LPPGDFYGRSISAHVGGDFAAVDLVCLVGLLIIPILMMPIFADGLRADIADPGPLGRAGFWLILAGMCLIVGTQVPLWRDQRAAARVLRDSAPTA